MAVGHHGGEGSVGRRGRGGGQSAPQMFPAERRQSIHFVRAKYVCTTSHVVGIGLPTVVALQKSACEDHRVRVSHRLRL